MWLLWFCGLGLCCLSGRMSGLVVFEVGWCFTWNVVGWLSCWGWCLGCVVFFLLVVRGVGVSRGTSLLSIFMAGYGDG